LFIKLPGVPGLPLPVRVAGNGRELCELNPSRPDPLKIQFPIGSFIRRGESSLTPFYRDGGGHVLHVIYDLTIAAENGVFGQVGPKMGSFDGGFGSSCLARLVGQKKAREIWFLCRHYNAAEALEMGLVNKVVPVAQLKAEGVAWANDILQRSPLAIRCLKSAFNAELDGQSGIQELSGNATMLYYMTEEAKEFSSAQREKRKPKVGKFPWLP